MKRYRQGTILLLSGLFFVLVLCYVKYLFTGGFTAEKVHCHYMRSCPFDFSAPDYCEKMLDQPFFYLGKGRQAYVFSSLDGNYVLKFLRDQKYRPSLWMRGSLFFHALSSEQQKDLEDQQERCSRAFISYQLACLELPSETKLLRASIGGDEDLKKTILLVDRFSRKIPVDLGKTSFLLQRKGEAFPQVLLRYHQKKDVENLKRVIRSFFETIGQRCRNKILVRDAHCTLQNTAVCGSRVIEIDVGSFYRDPFCHVENEIIRSAEPLREFLMKNLSEIVPFFEEEYTKAKER